VLYIIIVLSLDNVEKVRLFCDHGGVSCLQVCGCAVIIILIEYLALQIQTRKKLGNFFCGPQFFASSFSSTGHENDSQQPNSDTWNFAFLFAHTSLKVTFSRKQKLSGRVFLGAVTMVCVETPMGVQTSLVVWDCCKPLRRKKLGGIVTLGFDISPSL